MPTAAAVVKPTVFFAKPAAESNKDGCLERRPRYGGGGPLRFGGGCRGGGPRRDGGGCRLLCNGGGRERGGGRLRDGGSSSCSSSYSSDSSSKSAPPRTWHTPLTQVIFFLKVELKFFSCGSALRFRPQNATALTVDNSDNTETPNSPKEASLIMSMAVPRMPMCDVMKAKEGARCQEALKREPRVQRRGGKYDLNFLYLFQCFLTSHRPFSSVG